LSIAARASLVRVGRTPFERCVIAGSGPVKHDGDGDQPANATFDIGGGLGPFQPDDGVTAGPVRVTASRNRNDRDSSHLIHSVIPVVTLPSL